MNQISRKLRSKSGASMLIALMFMMFCLFVGGSVLAAATANGYRVDHISDEGDYLEQRSAALLIADELRSDSTDHLLTVVDVVQEVQRITFVNNVEVPVGDPVTYHTLSFQLPLNLTMTSLQRAMYETAIWQYLSKNAVDLNTTSVEIQNFYYQTPSGTEHVTSLAHMWFNTATTSGQITINGTKGGQEFTAFSAVFECDDSASMLYDFHVSFGNYSQLKVMLAASAGGTNPTARRSHGVWTEIGGASYDALITETTRTYTIYWDAPEIQKGGA